jgi:serine/threonine protein kinase
MLATQNVEPIPGYQLIERLGTGGYGEVWRTTAPGGLFKAIKVVYGDRAGPHAEQELKALERIKRVRHPFLLSLERFEVVEGHLLIVMELAEGSLIDRFQACRRSDLPGIPRSELLGYLGDAAEALDYMNETHGLQHLDIKPQNLLLVGGRVKVADFGLVKDLSGTSVTATGGVTPLYATPEAFDGRVSRYSDQYSLAIVYQEMLTGMRPFTGTTALQLATQHTTGTPLLDPLPVDDRPIVGRALAKIPEQRFPTCREMVDQLLHPGSAPTPAPAPAPEALRGKVGSLRHTPTPVPLLSVSPEPLDEATEIPACLVAKGEPDRPSPSITNQVTVLRGQVPRSLRLDEAGFRPTLFLGMGGIAAGALRRLRQRLHRRFGTMAHVPSFRLLLVDTDRTALREAQEGAPGEALESDETLLTPLYPPEHFRAQAKTLLSWIDRRWLYGIPRSLLTEGLRPLGNLALVDNAAAVLGRLRETLSKLAAPEAVTATAAATGMSPCAPAPRVLLLGSIAGGTAAGMLPVMAFAVRQVLKELGLPADDVCGVLAYATSPKPAAKDMARVNAVATLRELSHWSRPGIPYPGILAHDLASFAAGQAPLRDCYLVHLGDDLAPAEVDAATDVLAEYLYLHTAGCGDTFFDQFREATPAGRSCRAGGLALRTFGLSCVRFARHYLASQTAELACLRVVERWPGRLSDEDKKRLEEELRTRAAGLDLGKDETLMQPLHRAIAAVLGENPESYCLNRFIAPQVAAFSTAPDGRAIIAPALKQMHDFLRKEHDPEDTSPAEPRPFKAAVRERALALAETLSRQLIDDLIALVEAPGRRLKAADMASSWLVRHLGQLTASARCRLAQVQADQEKLRQRLAPEGAGTGSGVRSLSKSKPMPPGEPQRSLLEYWSLQLADVALANAVTVFGILAREVDAFHQDLLQCGQKLTQLSESYRQLAIGTDAPAGHPKGTSHITELLPGRSDTLATSAAAILNRLGSDAIRRLDETVQQQVLAPRGGLWGVLHGTKDAPPGRPTEVVKPKLHDHARAVVLEHLKETDAAALFLEGRTKSGQAQDALEAEEKAARPRLPLPPEELHLLLGTPASPAGQKLRDMVVQAYPDRSVTVVESENDVCLCYEAAQVPLAQAVAALIGDDLAAYAPLADRVMTRTDVVWLPFTPGA